MPVGVHPAQFVPSRGACRKPGWCCFTNPRDASPKKCNRNPTIATPAQTEREFSGSSVGSEADRGLLGFQESVSSGPCQIQESGSSKLPGRQL